MTEKQLQMVYGKGGLYEDDLALQRARNMTIGDARKRIQAVLTRFIDFIIL